MPARSSLAITANCHRSVPLARHEVAICLISFVVWLHHFFSMGAGADVNGAFGIATMIIAVATGVEMFNGLFTMYGGRIHFATPMLWSLGFLITFVIGGMTGVGPEVDLVPPSTRTRPSSSARAGVAYGTRLGAVADCSLCAEP